MGGGGGGGEGVVVEGIQWHLLNSSVLEVMWVAKQDAAAEIT